jgi:hypothetical protein
MGEGQTQTPRRHGSPDRPQRPLWPDRHFADEMPRSRFDQQAWDEAKEAFGAGTYDPEGRSPWL